MAKNPRPSKQVAIKPVVAPSPPATYTASTVVHVRAVGVVRRHRAGLCFTEQGRLLDLTGLSADQAWAITHDPHLKIDGHGGPETSAQHKKSR